MSEALDFIGNDRASERLSGPTKLSEAFSGITRMAHVRCQEAGCEREFETTSVRNLRNEREWLLVEHYCEEHRAKHREPDPEGKPAHRDLRSEWQAKCPKGFLDTSYGPERDGYTDPERIPEVIRAEFRRYRYSNIGICAIGPSRTFKSRTMHLLLKRLFFEGRLVTLMDGIGLGAAIADSFATGAYGLLIERLSSTSVLSLDDLDKVRVTERVDEAIFGIIDRRLIRGFPTFITTNLLLRDLAKHFGAQYGEPIVERIREHCRVIETAKLLGRKSDHA